MASKSKAAAAKWPAPAALRSDVNAHQHSPAAARAVADITDTIKNLSDPQWSYTLLRRGSSGMRAFGQGMLTPVVNAPRDLQLPTSMFVTIREALVNVSIPEAQRQVLCLITNQMLSCNSSASAQVRAQLSAYAPSGSCGSCFNYSTTPTHNAYTHTPSASSHLSLFRLITLPLSLPVQMMPT